MGRQGQRPIGVQSVPIERLDEFLDIARHGRFLLVLAPRPETPDHDIGELIRKVRTASNLG